MPMINPAVTEYNNQLLKSGKANQTVEEYNEGLRKSGKGGGSALGINSQDELKKKHKDFLLLLMTQIKHQDPMEPEKNEQFITQLVQFAQVEQSLRLNETQDRSLTEQRTSQLINASNFIGKEVQLKESRFEFQQDAKAKLGYEMPEGIDKAKIRIFDSKNTMVNSYDLEEKDLKQGKHLYEWDGIDFQGSTAEDGEYYFEIVTPDDFGIAQSNKNILKTVYQVVKGVEMDGDKPMMSLGKNVKMPLTSLLSIQNIAQTTKA